MNTIEKEREREGERDGERERLIESSAVLTSSFFTVRLTTTPGLALSKFRNWWTLWGKKGHQKVIFPGLNSSWSCWEGT